MINDLDELFELMMHSAHASYIGEPISQLEHALQAADRAVQTHNSETLVLSALFHDIGHLLEDDQAFLNPLGSMRHESLGARVLQSLGFSDEICTLVASHVAAKRFLAFKDQTYLRSLSVASRATLHLQGGPMTAWQAEDFINHPLSAHMLRLRGCDEFAKDPSWKGPGLSAYFEMARQHINQH